MIPAFSFRAAAALLAVIGPHFSFAGTLIGGKSPKPVSSEYNIPGGYFALDYVHGPPPQSKSCFEYSRSIAEPYTERYLPRNSLPAINDDVPRAFWRWSGGNFTLAEFKRAKSRKLCPQCMILHYKIKGGRLFVEEGASSRVPESRRLHRLAWEEMLSVVLYLYPALPDMEFLLNWDDECTNGLPVITPNVCRDFPKAGFTLPSFSVWSQSFGPVQMASFHACLWARYPPHTRKPLAVWRGSTTGVYHPETLEDFKQVPRLKLHLLSQNHSDILDARITTLTQQIPNAIRELIQPAERISTEDYNQYSVIIDVDGNGWSDRFGNSLVHYATPVLKMASNHTGFFEHLFAPYVTFVQFSRTLEDLPGKARQMITEVQSPSAQHQKSRYFHMVQNMQATSQQLMDHLGLAEAFAYTLLKYRSIAARELTGNTSTDGGDSATTTAVGFEEVPMTCCSLARVPTEFAMAVTRRLLRNTGESD